MTDKKRSWFQRLYKRNHGMLPRHRRNRRMLAEQLEQRQLLAADMEGDDLATAHVATLSNNVMSEFDATIGDGDHGSADVDLFKVDLAVGQAIKVDVDARLFDDGGSSDFSDSYLRVFDSSGSELSSNSYGSASNDFAGENLFDSYLSFVAPATGAYFIGVSSELNDSYDPTAQGSGALGASTGSYTLQLTVDTPPPSLSSTFAVLSLLHANG
jgi:hypothetical protein